MQSFYINIYIFCNVLFSLSLSLPCFITVLTVPIFLYRLCYPLSCEIGLYGSWDLNNIIHNYFMMGKCSFIMISESPWADDHALV